LAVDLCLARLYKTFKDPGCISVSLVLLLHLLKTKVEFFNHLRLPVYTLLLESFLLLCFKDLYLGATSLALRLEK
jgi:hypothetical protein